MAAALLTIFEEGLVDHILEYAEPDPDDETEWRQIYGKTKIILILRTRENKQLINIIARGRQAAGRTECHLIFI